MKIDESIRLTYVRQSAVAERLRKEVDTAINGSKESNWHYESRVKQIESFALKIEAARTANPDEIDDIFACVLVVPTFSQIQAAVVILQGLFGVPETRRPKSAETTSKSPSDFRFDDLRLYYRFKDQGFGPPTGLEGTLFEVQVRTFLQHAWTIATHDVIYKSANVSWRRERVAHHAKAALEQAEVTIESISALESSKALPESNAEFDLTNGIVDVLASNWSSDQLPSDVRRLAEALKILLRAVGVGTAAAYQDLLSNGKERYSGGHNLDWSPYRTSLQYAADTKPDLVKNVLLGKKGNTKIFAYPSVLKQLQVDPLNAKGAVILKNT